MYEKIFGYEWEEIKAMQQKAYVPRMTLHTEKQPPTEKDKELLKEHGVEGLIKLEYYGVLDRLGICFKNEN